MTCTIVQPDDAGIAAAVKALAAGGLVAFPTETVYGLGADATSDRAVAAIFAAKKRPRFNPLIVHVAGLAEAEALARFDHRARMLAARFWPGPLTLVLRRRQDCPISLLASAGLQTLAIRVPRHSVAQRLLARFGRPLAAPSANPSGRLSPTSAAHVAAQLGDAVALVLDGGPAEIGLESTIVDLSGAVPALLRHGGLPSEEIEALTGPLATPDAAERPTAPGMLESHYAPHLPLRLGALRPKASEAFLAFGPRPPEGGRLMLNLSPTSDLVEAAANLFAFLHRLDESGAAAIAVMPVPERGLGRAINDRLRRAAAPRQAREAVI
jgi:L-threonylcarbamoyladenylate synthase